MKTLSVRLSETLAAEIATESRHRRLSKSDVIRERLEARGKTTPRAAVLDAIEDLIGSLDHVIVGEDVAVLRDDEAGPGALLEIRSLRLHPGEELLEARRDLHLHARPALGVTRLDEHHARLDPLGDGGERLAEVGQGRGARGHRRSRLGDGRCGRLLGRAERGKVENTGDRESGDECEADTAGPHALQPSVRHVPLPDW